MIGGLFANQVCEGFIWVVVVNPVCELAGESLMFYYNHQSGFVGLMRFVLFLRVLSWFVRLMLVILMLGGLWNS